MDLIRELEAEQARKIEEKRKLPEFQPGDTVRVNVRVTEGSRTRVQAYEGVVIARAGSGFWALRARWCFLRSPRPPWCSTGRPLRRFMSASNGAT